MKCAECREQAVHVALGQAEAAVREAFEAHCRECATCRREAEGIAGVLRLLRCTAAPAPSASFRPRLALRMRRERRAEDEALERNLGLADRAAAAVAYVGYRLRGSAGARVLLYAAAVSLISLAAYAFWTSAKTERVPLERIARQPAAAGGTAGKRTVPVEDPAVPAPAIEAVDVEELARLDPPLPIDVLESLPDPVPLDAEELDPLPSTALQEFMRNTIRDNSLALSRFRMRLRFAGGSGGEVDRAINEGLRWLAEVQERDGSWDPTYFGGQSEARVGTTALCVLAFLSDTERGTPGGLRWRYVKRGLGYLREQVTADRTFGAVRGDRDVVLFNHATATLAFVENYVMGDREHEKLISDALERLEDLGARRRFRDRQEADNITAPWVALTLETARAAGVPAVIDLKYAAEDAQAFVAKLVEFDPVTGEALLPGTQLCAMACAAALDPLFDDVRDYDRYEPPIDLLLQHLRQPALREPTKIFFAAVDAHQRGALDWQRWDAEARQVLLAARTGDGNWVHEYEWDPVGSMGGDLYETALMIMTLAVPARVAH